MARPRVQSRAGTLGTPMMLAIIGGATAQFKPLVRLYRQHRTGSRSSSFQLKVGVSSHFHVQKDSQKAKEEFYSYYANYFAYVSRGRGREIRISPSDYNYLTSLGGALFVGSPQEIIDKIMYPVRTVSSPALSRSIRSWRTSCELGAWVN